MAPSKRQRVREIRYLCLCCERVVTGHSLEQTLVSIPSSVELTTNPFPAVHNIAPFLQVFRAYRTGREEEVKNSLAEIQDLEHAKGIRECLATLALSEGRADILEICLDQGFTVNGYLMSLVDRVQRDNTDPEMEKVINTRWANRRSTPRSIMDDLK